MNNKLSTYIFDQNCDVNDPIISVVNDLLGDDSRAQNALPSVKVFTQGEPYQISVANLPLAWQLTLESGEILRGKCQKGQIQLPANLPLGYHQLSLVKADETAVCRIIITPKTAYQPRVLTQQKHLWGAIIQLYTLRSAKNWGIGDFSDLQQFLSEIAKKGGDFVGLNPIHALFPANPESASPYSPSSRLWQNVIYIDVSAVEAFRESEAAQAWFSRADIQARLQAVRYKDYVDYSEVMALKLAGLRLAFAHFSQHQSQTDFEQFIAQNDENLLIQATFDALHQWLSEQHSEQWGWNYWADKYQDYRAPAVAAFQKEQAELVRFYMWLQFVAREQLKACNQLAQQLEMNIGFYRDLAVGVANNGAETWADKSLYVLDASIGAPPDMMAPQGQNWGLSPMHPAVLTQRAYQPFIDLLRANMQDCGALRIDHILGFMRLWWVAQGQSAVNGVYVKYPLADLLAILALESQRHQCLIIAEALGTVPEGILEALAEKGIFAYNLFYFEDENGAAKPLENYPYQAMTTLSTHDLPTVRGYWQGYDFELGQQYGVYPSDDVLAFAQRDRMTRKANILAAVTQNGEEARGEDNLTSGEFVHQLQRHAAHTHSALFGTQPEDWLNMLEPVNIPGTGSEYPNWRRKLAMPTDRLFALPQVENLLRDIDKIRK